jgi:hypothetical protein
MDSRRCDERGGRSHPLLTCCWLDGEQIFPPRWRNVDGASDRIRPDDWPDYRELGIGPEQLPELIQMATDEALHEAEEVEPLLELFDRLEERKLLPSKDASGARAFCPLLRLRKHSLLLPLR